MEIKARLLKLSARILSSEKRGSVIVAQVDTGKYGKAEISIAVDELEQLQQSPPAAVPLRSVS